MRNSFFALGLALLLTLSHTAHAFAGAPQASADWAAVQALSPGQKIVVRTKDGDRLTGRFESATDLLINFTDGRRKVSLTRESIRRVQLDRGNSRLRGTLIGAAIGGGAALAFGAWAYSKGDFNPVIVYGPGALGAGIGAGIGAATGKGNKNETVYEAP